MAIRSSFGTLLIRKTDLGADQPSIMFRQSRILDLFGAQGTLRTNLLSVAELGFSIGHVVSTGHEVWLNEDANLTFLLPQSGRLDVRVSGTDYRIDAGQFALLRPTERRTKASAGRKGQFQAITLQVATNRLYGTGTLQEARVLRALAGDFAVLTTPAARYLAEALPVLAKTSCLIGARHLPIRVAAELGTLIDEVLCEISETPVTSGGARRILPAWQRVCRVEDIMQARYDEALSMPDLAASVGISLRSLQLGFQEVYGLSPRAVLTRIRLEKARSRLLAADPADRVTSVALDSGFIHLSRFAQVYARTFGETPSETLAKRRG